VTDAAPGGVFEQVAQQALANAAFYPAQKEGRTVRSRILIKVEFDPALADTPQ
jgi:outer membrane biosynthesis protein TonB